MWLIGKSRDVDAANGGEVLDCLVPDQHESTPLYWRNLARTQSMANSGSATNNTTTKAGNPTHL